MSQATDTNTTSADLFLGGYQKAHEPFGEMLGDNAEAKGAEIIEQAAAHAQAVWAKPIGTLEAAIERAKVAFWYQADAVDENGSPCFAMEDLDRADRAVAELILALLALDKKDALNS